jgi:hypothetical protein
MTDIWDFSSLLESWSRKPATPVKQPDNYSEITEQMQKELDEISSQIALLDSADPATLIDLRLLTIPAPRPPTPPPEPEESTVYTRLQIRTQSQAKLPPLTSVSAKPAAKPKESMQMRAKRVVATPTKEPPNRPIFKATPSELKVVNFDLSKEYLLRFTLQNVSSHTCGFHLRGPADPAFRIRILDEVKNSEVRPGLQLTFEVIFFPTEPRDYDGSIAIIPGPDLVVTNIVLRCYRDPPQLVHPDIVDLGATLVFSVKPGEFTITNRGGIAFFELRSPTGRDGSVTYTDGAFSLVPSQFELNRGDSVTINVQFKPVATGEHSASFEILAQHFPQKFFFIVKGHAAVPCLKFAICDDDRLLLPFLPAHANTTRSLEIKNDAYVSYPFNIQVVRPRNDARCELGLLFSETDTTTVRNGTTPFAVTPISGLIGARESVTLNVTFSPKLFAFYRVNLVIYANRIPDETGSLGSRKMLTIAAEATTGPPSVFIHPPLVLFNDVVPRYPTKQAVDVVNDSFLNVKLQWRKSDAISPAPVVFDVASQNRQPVDLSCVLSRAVRGIEPSTSILFRHFSLSRALAVQSSSPTPSQHYAIAFAPLAATPAIPTRSDVRPADDHGDDDIPNIFRVRQWASCLDGARPIAPVTEPIGVHDDVCLQLDSFTNMTFTFSASIAAPSLHIDPPVVDFGCVLAGERSQQTITLINCSGCSIAYSLTYPDAAEWHVENASGVVGEAPVQIRIELQYLEPTPLASIITIRSSWVDENDQEIASLPTTLCDVPVYAVIDRPIVDIQQRVIAIGEVFPTLEYSASITISLLNSFPTDFKFVNYQRECMLSATTSAPSERRPSTSIQATAPIVGAAPARPGTAMAGRPTQRHFPEYTQTVPASGPLNIQESCDVAITAKFCELGDRALPFGCQVAGGSYTCVLTARVLPPKLVLLTETVDFSLDFVICKRSHSLVRVANECGVKSSVRLEMVDGCKGVFSLDDTDCREIVDTVEFPVSCYSEIHGDYRGSLKLTVSDPWQTREIAIPLHVKAMGSFFGFQKHTLGYTAHVGGDFVSFGVNLTKGTETVVRRLALENFSSEPINVDRSIANFVKGRDYATLDLDIADDGRVAVTVAETEDANEQSPFRLITSQTIVDAHGKTVVVVEFSPKDLGSFAGCVAARSGEFTHTVGLSAVVVLDPEAQPVSLGSEDEAPVPE